MRCAQVKIVKRKYSETACAKYSAVYDLGASMLACSDAQKRARDIKPPFCFLVTSNVLVIVGETLTY